VHKVQNLLLVNGQEPESTLLDLSHALSLVCHSFFKIPGNADGGIDVSSFQVTNMAQQLVKTGIIEACLDPTVVRVKESSGPRDYVPEVSYKSLNEYGVAVQKQAKPTFPVDYLIVSVLVPSF
jgi:hypothetical protein